MATDVTTSPMSPLFDMMLEVLMHIAASHASVDMSDVDVVIQRHTKTHTTLLFVDGARMMLLSLSPH